MTSPLDRDDLRRRVQACSTPSSRARPTRPRRARPRRRRPRSTPSSACSAAGKRLRAAFLYWGYRAAGRPDSDALVRLASAHGVLPGRRAASTTTSWTTATPAAVCRRRTGRSRPSTPRVAGRATPTGSASAGAILAGNLCLTWSDELTPRAACPRTTSPRPGASSTGCAPSSWPASSSTSSSRCARGTASTSTDGSRAAATGHPLQEREVHHRAPAAHRRPRRRSRRGRPRRTCPPTASPSARPSSCATTSSASSATPRPRASRRVTTCARASARCSSPTPSTGTDDRPGAIEAACLGATRPRRRRGRRAARASSTDTGAVDRLEDEIDRLADAAAPARRRHRWTARRRGPGRPRGHPRPAPPDGASQGRARSGTLPRSRRLSDVVPTVPVPGRGRERWAAHGVGR